MIDLDFTFESEIWLWQTDKAPASWHFVTLPSDMSEDIKAFTKHVARGFRSVKVSVTIGDTRWQTSLFPDTSRGGYLLPLKKAVRDAEGLSVGDTPTIHLSIPV